MATQSTNVGAFVPTSNVWDPAQILSTDINSPQFKELLVRLYQNLNLMANVVNVKDSGFYDTNEFVTGQQFFRNPSLSSSSQLTPQPRTVFRKTFNIGALGAGVTNTAHGLTITSGITITRLYGAASNTTSNNYYPLPFASAGGATNIELRMNATNIVITNNSGVTFDKTYVVVEFLKF